MANRIAAMRDNGCNQVIPRVLGTLFCCILNRGECVLFVLLRGPRILHRRVRSNQNCGEYGFANRNRASDGLGTLKQTFTHRICANEGLALAHHRSPPQPTAANHSPQQPTAAHHSPPRMPLWRALRALPFQAFERGTQRGATKRGATKRGFT